MKGRQASHRGAHRKFLMKCSILVEATQRSYQLPGLQYLKVDMREWSPSCPVQLCFEYSFDISFGSKCYSCLIKICILTA